MIKKFDKSIAAPMYKREFAEAMEDCLYEDALDCLIKFREETGMPDFHLVCGMLYLLISQTSDDREFYSLALREFLLHIRDYPDCREAYRNILAIVFLRHEPEAMVECGDWIRSRGFDMDEMLEELASADIDILTDSPDGVFLEDLFDDDGYGSISDGADGLEISDTPSVSDTKRDVPSKVIEFKGGKSAATSEKPVGNADLTAAGRDDGGAEPDVTLELIKSLAAGFDDNISADEDGFTIFREDEFDTGSGLSSVRYDSVKSRLLLRDAERHCERKQYEKALDKLDRIPKTDMHIYYCAQCLRGYIFIELDDLENAKASVDIALDIEPRGALAGTLLCGIYELKGETDKIPDVLLNTDIGDYIDADHACKAFFMAVKYCSRDEALDLAEELIDEYNVLSMRLVYAQMLYNDGEREDALKELYMLTRLQPTDFNVKYYYLLAKSDPPELPLGVDAPYKVLGAVVDNFITFMLNGTPSDEMLDSEPFQTGLEVFLTLEYDYDRRIMAEMFQTLYKLADDVRLEGKMRDALISPYVEPLIKAVILSRLFERDKKFLMEVAFCPMSDDALSRLGAVGKKTDPNGHDKKNGADGQFSQGFYTAYAFTAALGLPALKDFTEKAKALKPALDASGASERDKALYLLRTLKKTAKRGFNYDNRIDCALGYSAKTEASRAYKNLCALMDKNVPQGEQL